MFTGLVEEIGQVVAIDDVDDSKRFTVRGPRVVSDAGHGDSIAVDGVCLTVTGRPSPDTFTTDVMAESLDRSALGDLAVGTRVNLERALAAGGRLGGHLVQGHVDAPAALISRTEHERWHVLRFTLPPELDRYVVEKGSVTLSGVSLTVSAVSPPRPSDAAADDTTGWLEVSLIPTTLADTTLGRLEAGDRVNVEVDILAKYVERLTARD